MNDQSMIFSELDPELRRARKILRILGALAAGAAIAAVWLSSSSAVFAATPDAAALCREYFQAQKYDRAKMHCAAAAEDEDTGSQAAMGWMYLHGKGVPRNEAEAARLIKLSAEQGNIAASALLGGMYLDGAAVEKNPELAREWISKAAEGGHKGAQVMLGNLYMGERRDNGLALAKATAGSAAGSSGDTRSTIAEPRSVSQAAAAPDPEAAVKWYKKAAKNGSAAGQAALGEAYRLGLGVEQNEVSAYMWYTLAAEQGSQAAADARQMVAIQMEPEQIAKAEEKARDWKDSHADRIDRAQGSRR